MLMGDQILVISGVRGDTRRYRTFHLYEQLCIAGVPAALSHLTDPVLPGLVEQARVVIFHRVPWDGYVQRLFKMVERNGSLALLDTDDLTFDLSAFQWINSPDFADPIRAALYQEEMQRHLLTLEHCQGALASTNYLAGRVKAAGRPAWVHRNAFSLEMLAISGQVYQQKKAASGKVVIGYASGTPTHDRDFEQVRPALQRLMQRNSTVEVWLVGPLDPGPGWEPFSERLKRIPLVPWRGLPAILAQFDINLAPLAADNPFAQSKSEIKYVEAGLVGVPTIATPTEAFSLVIRPGINGLLAANDHEWDTALEMLTCGPQAGKDIGERARKEVMESYHPCQRAAEIVSLLNLMSTELMGRNLWGFHESWQPENSTPHPGPGWVPASEEKHPTYLEMGVYSLRHRGMNTLLRQIWVYFRRAISQFIPYRPRKTSPEVDA